MFHPSEKRGDGVAHSFNCTLRVAGLWLADALVHFFAHSTCERLIMLIFTAGCHGVPVQQLSYRCKHVTLTLVYHVMSRHDSIDRTTQFGCRPEQGREAQLGETYVEGQSRVACTVQAYSECTDHVSCKSFSLSGLLYRSVPHAVYTPTRGDCFNQFLPVRNDDKWQQRQNDDKRHRIRQRFCYDTLLITVSLHRIFAARCYASAAYAVMWCLSVFLSRSWIMSKTKKNICEFFLPSDSHTILVFPYQTG